MGMLTFAQNAVLLSPPQSPGQFGQSSGPGGLCPLSLWDRECRCHRGSQQLCLSTSIPSGSRELHGLLAWIVLDASGACRRCWSSLAMQRGWGQREEKALFTALPHLLVHLPAAAKFSLCYANPALVRALPSLPGLLLAPVEAPSQQKSRGTAPRSAGTAGAFCLPPAFFCSL